MYSEYSYFLKKDYDKITLLHHAGCTVQINALEHFLQHQMTIADNDMNEEEEDKNAFLAWKYREHFTYTSGKEGHNTKVQCKLCLPSKLDIWFEEASWVKLAH